MGVSCCCGAGLQAADWTLARSAHAEVYSQVGDSNARSMAQLIERLRAFFAPMMPPSLEERPPVRVVVFRSSEDYEPFRLHPASDAYYMGNQRRDYIVLPSGPRDSQTAAHEYWHVMSRNAGLDLPLWLEEGLAEVFSNLQFDERPRAKPRSPRPNSVRSQTQMPLAAILAVTKDAPFREESQAASRFYAASWALAEMLLVNPAYGPRFPEFLANVASGVPSEGALVSVYAKPLAAIEADLRAWNERARIAPVLVPEEPVAGPIEITEASPLVSGTVLADLLETSGKLNRAEALYRQLSAQAPDDPNVNAALASIALTKGDDDAAREWFHRAVKHGLQDDDALYHLALLENNAGDHEAALADLEAIRRVSPARQFAYWDAVAYAANQLGKRDQAEAAAENMLAHATNEAERAQASEQRLIAQTDVVVQFTRDDNGQLRLVNRRTRHDSEDWNPFIEPGDQVRRAEGRLEAIDCGVETTFLVRTSAGLLHLAIPDPRHVQMRNAPSDYTCGPQPPTNVSVVYAAAGASGGVLRGMEFRRE